MSSSRSHSAESGGAAESSGAATMSDDTAKLLAQMQSEMFGCLGAGPSLGADGGSGLLSAMSGEAAVGWELGAGGQNQVNNQPTKRLKVWYLAPPREFFLL